MVSLVFNQLFLLSNCTHLVQICPPFAHVRLTPSATVAVSRRLCARVADSIIQAACMFQRSRTNRDGFHSDIPGLLHMC